MTSLGAPPATLVDALRAAAGEYAHAVGLRFVDRREDVTEYTWGEIASRAQHTAAGLREVGVRPGDRVALVLPTSVEFFDAFFGAILAGATPVPLYPPVRLGRLDEYYERGAALLASVDTVVVLTDARVRKVLGPMIEAARPPLGLRLVADVRAAVGAPTGIGSMGFEPIGAGSAPSDPAPDALAMVQFSSGTTVEPKPVGLSHRAVMAQAGALVDLMAHYPEAAYGGVSWLPLYHDMGLIGCVFPALVNGAPLTLLGPELFLARPAAWLRALSQTRAMVSPAPNFAYALCVERVRDEDLAGIDLGNWRVALNGAEAVSPSVMRSFIERFAPYGLRPRALTPVYGLSEASLAVTFSDIDRPFRTTRFDSERLAEHGEAIESATGAEHVSVGTPLAGFDVEIRDHDGAIGAPGRVGRLFVRGPSIMDGYVGRPDATAAVLVDGWLDTGDLGFVHDGELYLTGRAKDVLIIRGRNHAPQDVERAIDRVDGVRTGCAVAATWAAADDATERLLVLVERARGSSRAEADIAADCRDAILGTTGLHADDVVIVAAGTLPRTSSGKLRRAEALHRHRAGELREPDPVNAVRIARAAWRSRRALRRFDSVRARTRDVHEDSDPAG